MKYRISLIIYLFFCFFQTFSQPKTLSVNKETDLHCTEANIKNRVKELTYFYINREYPGLINKDLSFSSRDGAVLNELLNENLKNEILTQIALEYQDCKTKSLLKSKLFQADKPIISGENKNNVKKDAPITNNQIIDAKNKRFGVQVYESGTYSQVSLYNLKDVKAYLGDDGIYRYYSGDFSTAAEAYPHKMQLRNLGCLNATVSLIQGQLVGAK